MLTPLDPSGSGAFGQVPVNGSSTAFNYTIRNTGAGSASVTVTQSNPTWFDTSLAAGSFTLGVGSGSGFTVRDRNRAHPGLRQWASRIDLVSPREKAGRGLGITDVERCLAGADP